MKQIIKVYYQLEQSDKIFILKQLLDLGYTLRQFARIIRISPAYLSDILNGNRHLSPDLKDTIERRGIKIH